jgi:glutamate/tyrosine decarboxylase-like PLP-dependent enzyme
MSSAEEEPDTTLDPKDWEAFSRRAHDMLDRALDKMRTAREGPVWRAPGDALHAEFDAPLPPDGIGGEAVSARIEALLPYGVGNTHPRFFGWVHGSGTPSGLIPDIAAVAMNANLGGRDHGAIAVEKQVVRWCREMFGYPEEASGLIVSGTSLATLVAIKVARDKALNFAPRRAGVDGARLTGYTSVATHSCVAQAFDILGLGSDALRSLPVTNNHQIDLDALRAAIARDRAQGCTPFVVIGTAGSVDLGAIDDLDALADIARDEGLWYHIDGAFGALAILSDAIRPRLKGIERSDSLAFDFHKWLHVTYDAGFVLVRSEEAHRHSFAERPDYLQGAERGLAAGNPWPVDYGPELSRGFRALKIWAQLAEHGPRKLGAAITANCEQAQYLGRRVADDPALELLAPVMLNICCFRYVVLDHPDLDALNDEIVVELQCQGIAAPSTTTVSGKRAIRVNLTNHRTRLADLDLLLQEIHRIGAQICNR